VTAKGLSAGYSRCIGRMPGRLSKRFSKNRLFNEISAITAWRNSRAGAGIRHLETASASMPRMTSRRFVWGLITGAARYSNIGPDGREGCWPCLSPGQFGSVKFFAI